MKYFVGILILTTTIAGLIKAISAHISWLKRWSWRLTVFIEIIGIAVAVTYLFEKEPQPPLTEDKTRQIVEKAVKEEISPLSLKIDSLEERVNSGFEALQNGIPELSTTDKEDDDLRDSLKTLAQWLAQFAETAMDSGLIAIGLGDYNKAITHLNYALQATQDSTSKRKGYFYRGVAYHLWGNSLSVIQGNDSASVRYELALACYDSALAYKRNDPRVWYNLSICLAQLGRYNDAIAGYDSSLAYKHDRPEVWCNRASALIHLGRFQEAIASAAPTNIS